MDMPSDLPSPPTAEQRPYSYERHGVTIEDPWHWLRDPKYPEVDNPDVLAYLNSENAYFEGWKAQHQGLIDQLFDEMKGRIKEDDSSVPIRDGDFLYWWAFKPGAQYRTWFRKPASGGADEVIFDEPAEAHGSEYFRLGALEPSPDGKLLATLVDVDGSERFKLRIRDVASGKDIATVTNVGIGQPVWTGDSAGIVFTEVNDNWRSYRAQYHRIGAAPEKAITLYEETEELGFSVGVGKSHDKSLIMIATGDNATSEVRFVSANDPSQPLMLISRRKPNREYHVDAAHGKLWIHTNDDHVNFRLAEADVSNPEEWRTVIAGSDRVYLTGVTSYRDHLAISSRVEGLDQLVLRTYAGEETRIPFAEASYSAFFMGNPEFAPDELSRRLFVDGHADDDLRLSSRERRARGPQGAGDPERLRRVAICDRAADGRCARRGEGAGVRGLQEGLREERRGQAVPLCIRRIRNGDPAGLQLQPDQSARSRMGVRDRAYPGRRRPWLQVVPRREAHHADQHVQRLRRRCEGADRGEVHQARQHRDQRRFGRRRADGGGREFRSRLWGAVVADVPFVDVLNTMLDDTLPLTPGEWPEWGNPIVDKAAFDYIRSYSPYDNVKPQDYPPMLITGGLTDPRVTYWEPAKWAAKLRATKTDNNILLLKINMGAGHGGKSGRWEKLHEVAETYAFILTETGKD